MKNAQTRKSLKTLAKRVRLQFTFGAAMPRDKQEEWQQKANGYRCTLIYKGRRYTFDFWQGPAITEDPTAVGCLDCLLSDCTAVDGSFQDFCGEMGYDSDSRKAERVYKACQNVRKQMERLLGADFEDFLYADRD